MRNLAQDGWMDAMRRGVYCFGGGRGLRSFAVCLREEGLLDGIVAIVDNDATRWGTVVTLEGRSIEVISPGELRRRIRGEAVIISCKAAESIRAQLARYHELAETSVGYYRDFLDGWQVGRAERVSFSGDIGSTKEPRIPKVIHYCWFGGAPIPANFRYYIEGWRRFCPDYDIRQWDESNYDVTKNAYMKAAYEAKKWAFVSDFARLDLVCTYGGFYFDTDVELVKNLDELRCNEAFMGMDLSGRVSSGLGIGSVAHQPMMEALRDAYAGYAFTDFQTPEERWTKQIQLCPDLQSHELEHYGFVRDCWRMQDIRGVRIYPVPVLCGQIGDRRIVTEHTYAVHHYAGTWVPDA